MEQSQQQAILIDPSSDEFQNILETAVKNEVYLSNVTLYKLWMRLYYSLEQISSAEPIKSYATKTQWALFVDVLLKRKISGDEGFVSSIQSLADDGFIEAKSLYLRGIIRNALQKKEDPSEVYWKLRDLYDHNSIEAAYQLGLIYLRSPKVGDLPKSAIFEQNIPAAISCFEFAISARKREAYRQLGIIQGVKGSYDDAERNFVMALRCGDLRARAYLDALKDAKSTVKNASMEQRGSETTRIPDSGQKEREQPTTIVAAGLVNITRFVVLDFETTGFSPRSGDRIIEIGAVEIRDGKRGREYQTLVNPLIRISQTIENVTSITNSMVKNAPTSKTEIPRLLEFISDAVLVAHNIDFELKFLRAECELLGLENPTLYISTLCTLKRARRLYPALNSHKLGDLLKQFSIPVNGPLHRALPDARATADLLLMMIEQDPQGTIDHIQKRSALTRSNFQR